MKLVVESPTFFSLNDEGAMFDWLTKLTFLTVELVGGEFHLKLARRHLPLSCANSWHCSGDTSSRRCRSSLTS